MYVPSNRKQSSLLPHDPKKTNGFHAPINVKKGHFFVVDFFVWYFFTMLRMEDGVVLKACYTKHSSSHLSLCIAIRDLFRMIIMMSSVFLFSFSVCKLLFCLNQYWLINGWFINWVSIGQISLSVNHKIISKSTSINLFCHDQCSRVRYAFVRVWGSDFFR